MNEKRELLEDSITPKLVSYSKKIGEVADRYISKREEFRRVLEWFNHHDEFYTETDLKLQKITWAKGINSWLGYADPIINEKSKPSLDYISEFVHPVVKNWYNIFTKAAILIFTQIDTNKVKNVKSRFVITIPVMKENGQYVLIRQMSMPFGKDDKGRLVSFINSYTVFGAYRGEPMKLEVYDEGNNLKEDIYKQIEDQVCSCLDVFEKENLSPELFSIIDVIADLRKSGIDVNYKNIGIHSRSRKAKSEDAIKKSLGRINEKLRGILKLDKKDQKQYNREFLPPYKTSKQQLIDYFIQSGFISLLKKHSRQQKAMPRK
jgi:hypothetical protein